MPSDNTLPQGWSALPGKGADTPRDTVRILPPQPSPEQVRENERLQRLDKAMIEAARASEDYRPGDFLIALVTDHQQMSQGCWGYADPAHAIADLVIHLQVWVEGTGGTTEVTMTSVEPSES